MGNTDSIPIVSQVKSLVQVIGGDENGALKTQENFIRTAPIAAQINSLVHHAKVSKWFYFYFCGRVSFRKKIKRTFCFYLE